MKKITGTAAKKNRRAADSNGGTSDKESLITVKLKPQIATTTRAIMTSRGCMGRTQDTKRSGATLIAGPPLCHPSIGQADKTLPGPNFHIFKTRCRAPEIDIC